MNNNSPINIHVVIKYKLLRVQIKTVNLYHMTKCGDKRITVVFTLQLHQIFPPLKYL